MTRQDEHIPINRAWWDDRAPAHATSADYAVAALIADPTRLSDVVRFDVPRLGDVTGQRGLHLQCHIGTDTLSLHRRGAVMTGLDFSPESIAIARRIAADADADVNYVLAEVYDAPAAVDGGFDFVFTGIGALCWLPDVGRWAKTVAELLRPGGRLFLRELHPMMLAFDEQRTDEWVLRYSYFEQPEPGLFDAPGSYVHTEAEFGHNQVSDWRRWNSSARSPVRSSLAETRHSRRASVMAARRRRIIVAWLQTAGSRSTSSSMPVACPARP